MTDRTPPTNSVTTTATISTPTTNVGASLALLHPERLSMVLAIEAEARAPLDVERLARALFGVLGWPHRLQPLYMDGDFDNPLWAKWATDIAREYAALEEPTP